MFKSEPAITTSTHREIVEDWKQILAEARAERDFLKRDRDYWRRKYLELQSAPGMDVQPAALATRAIGGERTTAGAEAAPFAFDQGWTFDDRELYEWWCAQQGAELSADILEERWLHAYGQTSPLVALSG